MPYIKGFEKTECVFLITIKKGRKPGVSQPSKENERDKDKIPSILRLK